MTKRGNGRGFITYKAYVFKDKDPVIDQLRTMAQRRYGSKLNYKSLRQIQDAGGPTVGCMVGWFFKDTRSPKNPTIEAAGRAMGKKRVWVDM